MTAFGIRLRAHPLAAVMFLCACAMGQSGRAVATVLAVTLHELAHVLAARALRLRVREIEWMPFGGAARLDGVWTLRPAQIAAVALAGPACNLLLLLGAFFLWRVDWLPYPTALAFARANLLLMLFNLLPALPLDGGRVLCAALNNKLGAARAAAVGVWLGRTLAAGLLALTVWQFFLTRRLNLTPVLLSAFLVASCERERLESQGAALRSLADRRAELLAEGGLPIRWLAVPGSTQLYALGRMLKPRVLHMIELYDESMRAYATVNESQLAAMLMLDPSMTLDGAWRVCHTAPRNPL